MFFKKRSNRPKDREVSKGVADGEEVGLWRGERGGSLAIATPSNGASDDATSTAGAGKGGAG